MLRHLFLPVLLLGACQAGPFDDYVLNPDIFVATLDEADAVDLRGTPVFPDQVLVAVEEGTDPDTVVAALGGTLIGAIPDLGFYEIRLPTSDLPALDAALDAAAALPGVLGVAKNALEDWYQDDDNTCLIHDDNLDEVAREHRCPFTDVQAYSATTVLREVAKHRELTDVRVAVVDSGLQYDFGQFDDVDVLNLLAPADRPTDTNGHGTRVAGLIAADNHDGNTNGLATAIVDDHIELVVGGFQRDSFALIASVQRAAIDAHADIVNMSFGRHYEPADARDQATIKGRYAALVQRAANTLFVAAAGNANKEITATNRTPGGLQASNFITVGGTMKCDPHTAWVESDPTKGSDWGPLVDISAPAQAVPVLAYAPSISIHRPAGPHINASGTSYAAPMVSAAAALFRSFHPTISATRIRDYLLDEAWPSDARVGYRRLVLVTPLEQMLIDRGASQDVLNIIDLSEPLGEWDVPGQSVNRLCGGGDLVIEGVADHHFDAEQETSGSFVNDAGFGIILNDVDASVSFTLLGSGQPFDLLHDYAIPSALQPAYLNADNATVGNGTAGSLVFTRCEIIDRSGLNEAPLWVQVEGSATGTLEMIQPPSPDITDHTFTLEFVVPMITLGGVGVADVLERQCDGGKQAGP